MRFLTFLNSQLAFILAMNLALCKWDRQRIRFQKTIHRDILFFIYPLKILNFPNGQLAFILAMNLALCKWDLQRFRFQKTIYRDILFFSFTLSKSNTTLLTKVSCSFPCLSVRERNLGEGRTFKPLRVDIGVDWAL